MTGVQTCALPIFNEMRTSQALEALWELVRALNKYVDSEAPWKLQKENNFEALGVVFQVLLECMRKIALCLWPVMPEASFALLRQLGQQVNENEVPCADIEREARFFEPFANASPLATASRLFPRLEMPEDPAHEAAAKKKAENAKSASAPAEKTGEIDIDTFKKAEMKTGIIRLAERHPKAIASCAWKLILEKAKTARYCPASRNIMNLKNLSASRSAPCSTCRRARFAAWFRKAWC